MPKLWDYPIKKVKQVKTKNRREILERLFILSSKRNRGHSIITLSRNHLSDSSDGSFFVARTSWPSHRFVKVTQVMARGSGEHGRAWGITHAHPSSTSTSVRRLKAAQKKIWRRVSQRDIDFAKSIQKSLHA
eukprot:CAMPEP_0117429112 /NCGR_PEP_ID=MMETSP0758-20121206/8686_1 /TAXON_ID=63605 /ORGANISM="Percolomonas cosmopolitus, Strain AE-1 (ATCC 50343)" /LENGTH=131 /DNA_ID=CAMNT_0005215875 /DNA_START=31 /DNA_END=423 /DNA_ORIENTATION=+